MSSHASDRPAAVEPPRGAAWTRAHVAWVAVASVFALTVQFGRPILWGSSLLEMSLHVGCLVLYVVLPGWALVRLLRVRQDDWLHDLGLGWVLGTVLLTFVFLALHALNMRSAILAWPMIVLPLHFARTHAREPARATPVRQLAGAPVVALIALIGFAALRTQMLHPAEWWYRFQLDTYFHAGNAAALLHGLPIENPRIAGDPLNYHVLSYVPFTVERIAAGLSIEALFLRVGVNTLPLLLLVQVFNLGRTLGRSAWAGVLAATLVMLHVDPAEKFGAVVHPWFGVLNAYSYLEFGVYYSPSTCVGLACFATLVILLRRWFEVGRRLELGLAALIALYASGAKGSVMPVVLAGLGLLVVVLFVRGVRWSSASDAGLRRALVALVALAIAAAPASLILASGEHSYARSMFRVLPWATPHEIPLAQAIAAALDGPGAAVPHWVAWCLAPLWVPCYLGWSGVVALVGAWLWRRSLTRIELYLVACALAGLALSNTVAAPGASHLFFVYNGQVGLAVLTGAFVVRGLLGVGLRRVVAVACAAPAAVGILLDFYFRSCEDVKPLPLEPPACREYRDALEWVRLNTPEDAVVVTARREVLASVLAERSAYYETELYTPGYHATGWDADTSTWKMPEHQFVYTHRNEARRELFRAPNAAAVAEIRKDIGSKRPLYVIFDRIRWRNDPAFGGLQYGLIDELALPALDRNVFQPVFENSVARVVRCALPPDALPR